MPVSSTSRLARRSTVPVVRRGGGESDKEAFAKQIWTVSSQHLAVQMFLCMVRVISISVSSALIDRPWAANDIIIIHAL